MNKEQTAADVAAINELRDSLDEESLSELVHRGDKVTFCIVGSTIGKCQFSLTIDGSAPAQLACTNKEVPGLEALNAKLAGGCSLGRTLALLGRRVDVDLDWAEEATGGSSSDDEPMHDRSSDDDDEGAGDGDGHASDDGMDDAIREWSRRLVQ